MSSQLDTTVIICARYASETIGRAIALVVSQADYPVLVVDDYSNDETAERALSFGKDRVSIDSPDKRIGLGNARQNVYEKGIQVLLFGSMRTTSFCLFALAVSSMASKEAPPLSSAPASSLMGFHQNG